MNRIKQSKILCISQEISHLGYLKIINHKLKKESLKLMKNALILLKRQRMHD